MGTPPLKHPSPTNHGHGPLPLLETDHTLRSGSNSTKNQGILNHLRNLDRVVRPDMTPAAGNIAAKTVLPHLYTNQQHGPLPLPINDHEQEEKTYSLENQGITSSKNPPNIQGISNKSFQLLHYNLTMVNNQILQTMYTFLFLY